MPRKVRFQYPGAARLYQDVSRNGVVSVTNTGDMFVPQTPEVFAHDLDGNLTNDGRWSYTWDAENRLVAMAANTLPAPQISIKFDYDANGRRTRKQVWPNATWNGSPIDLYLVLWL